MNQEEETKDDEGKKTLAVNEGKPYLPWEDDKPAEARLSRTCRTELRR
jgi:hypothetical protein